MQCVLMDIQNGCHLAILNKINVKIWWVVSITLIHKPTRYCESHLKTMCVILFTDIKTDTSDYITSMSEVTKILYYLLTIYVIVGIKLLSVVYCFFVCIYQILLFTSYLHIGVHSRECNQGTRKPG